MQLAGFKDLTKESAMKMSASDRATHCATYAAMNEQLIGMMKDCSPEVSKALDMAKGLCSGTSKQNERRLCTDMGR